MKLLAFTLFITLLGLNVNNNIIINLGESKCYFKTKIKTKSGIGLVALHENETTCIKAFHKQKSSTPFYLSQISHGNGRLIKFKHKTKYYFIDPNRIFTKNGIEQTLKKYNNKYPKEVYNLVKSFSDSLISKIIVKNKYNKIIAIHNNTDKGFSIFSFQNSKNKDKININNLSDPDDFFLVTTSVDFEILRKNKKNVVLQSINAEDDGSLSVYCQKYKIPYINIEAQNGHLITQINMIETIEKLIVGSNPQNMK
jgi:hypothetical protein